MIQKVVKCNEQFLIIIILTIKTKETTKFKDYTEENEPSGEMEEKELQMR